MSEHTHRAAVFRPGLAEARIETLQMRPLRQDELLVRLVATGICHTDLTCRDGFMALPRPIVLGHEGAGIVEAIGGDVTSHAVGDFVVLSFASCGVCRNCRDDAPAYCEQFVAANMSGRRLDGSTAWHDHADDVAGHFFGQSSFATHSVVQARSAVRVRADAPLELLGPLGCGVLTGAGAVFNVLAPRPGGSIAIYGAGSVGLSAIMAAKVAGCDTIVAVEPVAARRALASELGATHVIDPVAVPDVAGGVRAAAGGGVDHAVETSGIQTVIGHAVDALASRGTIALITVADPQTTLPNPLFTMLLRGIGVRGVSMGDCRPAEMISKLVDLFMQDRFPIDRLVRFYDFADINIAFADQQAGFAVKPIVRMDT